MSIRRFAFGAVVAGAAIAMCGGGVAGAVIPLQPASSAPNIQAPQPVGWVGPQPATGSFGSASGTGCNPLQPLC